MRIDAVQPAVASSTSYEEPKSEVPAIHVITGKGLRVHLAFPWYGSATGHFVTGCGMYGRPLSQRERGQLPPWMRQVDDPVTCKTCLRKHGSGEAVNG